MQFKRTLGNRDTGPLRPEDEAGDRRLLYCVEFDGNAVAMTTLITPAGQIDHCFIRWGLVGMCCL